MATLPHEAALRVVRQLVDDFAQNANLHRAAGYQEAEARKDYIDKFLIALGWDVNHEHQKNPFEQEVKVERPTLDITANRRPDYSFYIAPNFRDTRLTVEAKRPFAELAVPLNYFQAVRYGWNNQNPLAALTNFEHLHLLDCRYKPAIDSVLHRAVRRYNFRDYANDQTFAEIYWLLSREAVGTGSLEKFSAALPRPRRGAIQRGLFPGAYQSIDASFLQELDDHRTTLARAFKRARPSLDGNALTELTQRALDRLVFMRFLEDKLIEPEHLVSNFGATGASWRDFIAASRRLDGVYDGIVFRRHALLDADHFAVDDDVFAEVCERLSHLNSPYDFNLIPIHILGSIYERFLGNVIVVSGARVHVEPKPEVRKAGGVYYTDEHVVRYIVAHSVGSLIAGRTPAQISRLRFIDIACGSGSFLLGVYDALLAYHAWYYNQNPRRVRRGECVEREGMLQLSLGKKREILLNNIYGVDIDPQAVEVTQLSLYLKLLDDETIASAHNYQTEIIDSCINNAMVSARENADQIA